MDETAAWYSRFARVEAAGRSQRYEEWALGVAADPDTLAIISELPLQKRQPSLVFASARWHGCPVGPYAEWAAWLSANWAAVRETASQGQVQTNEPGRCAALFPALSAIRGPIALLEVGASAGLCLFPDRYSYRFGDLEPVHPLDGPSAVSLECAINDRVPVPAAMPEIVWRAGIDLNPLDASNPDDARWLDALVWPDDQPRRERLAAAIDIAAADPPRISQGDAVTHLASLAREAPAGATLVVVTAGVLVYLKRADRDRFLAEIRTVDAAWLALESARLFDSVVTDLRSRRPVEALDMDGPFALSLDGRALALAGAHGQFLDWL